MEDQYVVVDIETRLGAKYTFPDMPLQTLEVLLNALSQTPVLDGKKLMLTNASDAVMQLPCRILKSIHVTEEQGESKEMWRCNV